MALLPAFNPSLLCVLPGRALLFGMLSLTCHRLTLTLLGPNQIFGRLISIFFRFYWSSFSGLESIFRKIIISSIFGTFNLLFEFVDLEPFYLGLNKFKMDRSLKNFQSLCFSSIQRLRWSQVLREAFVFAPTRGTPGHLGDGCRALGRGRSTFELCSTFPQMCLAGDSSNSGLAEVPYPWPGWLRQIDPTLPRIAPLRLQLNLLVDNLFHLVLLCYAYWGFLLHFICHFEVWFKWI